MLKYLCSAQKSNNLNKVSPNVERICSTYKKRMLFTHLSEMHLSNSKVLDKYFVLLAFASPRVKLE